MGQRSLICRWSLVSTAQAPEQDPGAHQREGLGSRNSDPQVAPREGDVSDADKHCPPKLEDTEGPPAVWAVGIASHPGLGPRHVQKCCAGRLPRKVDRGRQQPRQSWSQAGAELRPPEVSSVEESVSAFACLVWVFPQPLAPGLCASWGGELSLQPAAPQL